MSQVLPGEPRLLDTLKRVAAGLKRAGVPFALGGSYAAYARGGPEPEHDVDFVLREQDVQAALGALEAEGHQIERPPEDWLVKVYDVDRPVDLIFRLNGRPVTREHLEEATHMEVGSVLMPVLSATELVISRMLAFTEHHCDFGALLPMVRAMREQVDWDRVRAETSQSPYAHAFLVLVDGLGLLGGDGTGRSGARPGAGS